MIKLLLILSAILLVSQAGISSAQTYDTKPSLSVILTSDSPFVYVDEQGYTTVIGEVENTNKISSVSNVRIRANFYSDSSNQPLEVSRGSTILSVIPPLGKSPYIVKSATPNADIKSISVAMEGFISSPSKQKGLQVAVSEIFADDEIHIKGKIKNIGGANSGKMSVYLAFYDTFNPPRLVGIESLEIQNITNSGEENYEFHIPYNNRAMSVTVMAESEIFLSDTATKNIPPPQLLQQLVTISNVTIIDEQGSKLSEIKSGQPIMIQSSLSIESSKSNPQGSYPYVFYVQVKQSGNLPYVEHISSFSGQFSNLQVQKAAAQWTPSSPGLYFIETYVWDQNGIPMAARGPIILVLIN